MARVVARPSRSRPASDTPRPRRVRRSSIAGTGGGRRNTGRGGPGGEARPSPGSSPPGTPDLRDGAEVTVTTGPVSDAIDRLQAEHREIAALLARGPRAAARLADLVSRHLQLEESVFYPALRRAAGPRFGPMLTEAIQQQRALDRLLQDLPGLPPGAARRQRIEEMKTRMEAHVAAVEKTLFPEALRRLSRPERVTLGERMDLLGQES